MEKGHLVMRAPSSEVVDHYLSAGHSKVGERVWKTDEIPSSSAPFTPIALRLRDGRGQVIDTMRSTEAVTIELEYRLSSMINGLRIGFYLNTARAESVLTSFDTDDPTMYEKFTNRSAGHYISRCVIPADTLNQGRYSLGINASSYRIQRYFQDEQALDFNVDGAGAPGMQWPEPRPGVVRPRMRWTIEAV